MSDTASKNKISVQVSIEHLKEKFDEVLKLSNTWLQLAGDKNQYENIGRNKEIENKIKSIPSRFTGLVSDVQDGAQRLKELNREFNQSISINLITNQVFNVNEMACELSV
ncbi:unnamed protein product [Rotaria socialis]|uniref:Uncharacterized protein n=1 Tax=Rotaria socialis TaxID=392032 RepID=A0A821QRT4_9BILA|nr:unnamed protein product [Rotaria socialis]CAF4826044.1 unnamed protein product [Rotaria socialis]